MDVEGRCGSVRVDEVLGGPAVQIFRAPCRNGDDASSFRADGVSVLRRGLGTPGVCLAGSGRRCLTPHAQIPGDPLPKWQIRDLSQSIDV